MKRGIKNENGMDLEGFVRAKHSSCRKKVKNKELKFDF